jgi:hypothetical protein
MVDGHECLVQIRNKGMAYKYTFAVDGSSVDTGQAIVAPEELHKKERVQYFKMPYWGWGFIAAILLLGLFAIIMGGAAAISITGVIPERRGLVFVPPALVLLYSAILVADASSKPDLQLSTKALKCAVITSFSIGLALAVTFGAALILGFAFRG